MTNDHLLYEKIDLYLKNALPEGELSAFSVEINDDTSLQELVNTQRIANQIVYTKQLINLKEKMSADLNGLKSRYNFRSLFWTGLVVMLKIVLISYFIDFSPKPTTTVPAFVLDDTDNTPVEHFTESSRRNVSKKTTIPGIPSAKKDVTTTSIVDSGTTAKTVESKNIDNPITDNLKKADPTTELTSKEILSNPDCSHLNIDHAITAFSTCAGEQNGKITINDSKIKGGKSPFNFSLHKKENLSAKKEFHYLNAGTYTIYISDANQCVITKNIEIEEKSCKKSYAFAFTPELEKWKIPVQQNKQGTITIFNKSGILVYTSEVSSDQENFWDGISSGGQLQETGYFTYKINYLEGDEEIGSVSIMRR